MSFEYRIKDQFGCYFVTFTVHQWVDVFTRDIYKDILITNLNYCINNKGLLVYGWVIMSNHIHLIISSNQTALSDIIRDFKKFTSKSIYEAIKENPAESRKNWMLWLFTKDQQIWFWEEGYHGEEITSRSFFESKLNYIHMNPVRAGIVEKEEEYLYSSCGELYGIRSSLVKLEAYI